MRQSAHALACTKGSDVCNSSPSRYQRLEPRRISQYWRIFTEICCVGRGKLQKAEHNSTLRLQTLIASNMKDGGTVGGRSDAQQTCRRSRDDKAVLEIAFAISYSKTSRTQIILNRNMSFRYIFYPYTYPEAQRLHSTMQRWPSIHRCNGLFKVGPRK